MTPARVRLRPRRRQRFPRESVLWLARLGRIGYAGKGFVYAAVGVMALSRALGLGGRPTDPRGVLSLLGSLPGGAILLVPIALGLAAYAVWRAFDALAGPRAPGLAALGERAGAAAAAVVYGGLTWIAARAGLGKGAATPVRTWVAEAFGLRHGPLLLYAAGLGALGFAAVEVYLLWTARFLRLVEPNELATRRRNAILLVGRIGLGARAAVFATVGVQLLKSALRYDPRQAGGIGEALNALAEGRHGGVVLGAVACGLLLYAAECFVLAFHLRIRRPG